MKTQVNTQVVNICGYGREAIENRIRTCTRWLGRQVCFYDETDSTNERAKQAAVGGTEDGTLFVADMQTSGKGRRGRQWNSPAGSNIYFTLLLKPKFPPDKASMLTLLMAYAVWQGVAQYTPCGIKWPNDIVVKGRKVCGILTEMSVEQGRIQHVVIGVGINVGRQEFAPELGEKATSLEQECGQSISKTELLVDILAKFEAEYEKFIDVQDLSGIREAYNACLVNCDRDVRVLEPKGEYNGIARGITDTGELLVELADGSVEAVYAGEVSVRGIYGYV